MSDINLTRHMNHLIEAKDIREENEQLKQALAKCMEEKEELRDGYSRIIGTIHYMQKDDSTKERCLMILSDIAKEEQGTDDE